MDSTTQISIVIPIKNRSWCLPSLFESIEHQDFPRQKTEVIFIDNMSTDETYKLICDWRSKVENFKEVIIDRISGPLPKVRNRGIELSNTENILFLDSDITFSKNAISRIVKHTNNKEIDIFHAPCIPTNMNLTHKIMSLHNIKSLEKGETVRVKPSRTEFGFTIFRKSFFHKVGLFNEDSSLDGKRGNWSDMELMHKADKLQLEAIIDYSIRVTHLKKITYRFFFKVYLSSSHSRWFLESIKKGDLFQFGRLIYYLGLPIILFFGIFTSAFGLYSTFGTLLFFLIGLSWNIKSRPDKFPLVLIRALANIFGGVLLVYNSASVCIRDSLSSFQLKVKENKA